MFPSQNPLEPYPVMSNYFSSLPLFVQESIMQSGIKLEDEKQLRSFAEQLMNKKK